MNNVTKRIPKFIARHGLYDDEMKMAAEMNRIRIEKENVEMIRLAWPDQHGVLRGKAVTRETYFSALESGMSITMGPFTFDTANQAVFDPFTSDGGFTVPGLGGSPDITMVPDPRSFTILPWVPDTGWVMCDLYMPDGRMFPYAPRSVLKQTLEAFRSDGYHLATGLEMEWYLTKLLEPAGQDFLGAPGSPADPPKVQAMSRGYSLHLDRNLDALDDILRPIRKAVVGLGLPLRSIDDEWAPSQVETTFQVQGALATADAAIMFRSATKQIAWRHGCHASFMCTPAIEGFYANGWHLHSSVCDLESGENLMVPEAGEELSELGRHYVGGTLAHGKAASVFTTPTINGYRRVRPYSLAPDRLTWGWDNRAAMIRVISTPYDPISHVENRIGDSAANPYLYIAAQAAAGLDGIRNKIDPGPIQEDPYSADVDTLPSNLASALDELESDSFFREAFGGDFVDYMIKIKRSEVARFNKWVEANPDVTTWVNGVTDWEQREYFELY